MNPSTSDTALHDITSAHSAFRPPKRVSVAQGVQETLYVRQPGGYTGYWSPEETPYMVEPMNMLASRRHEAVAFVGPARTGKALDINTPIPTPTGWLTMGELKVGDTIYDQDGQPTKVVFATEHQFDRPCFEVAFSDGTSLIADADHRWGVERFYHKAPSHRYEVRTTAEMSGDLKHGNRFRYRIRNALPIFCEDADLSIDPYLLGVWLGDGASSQAYISSHKDDAQHYIDAFSDSAHHADMVDDGENTVFICVDMRTRLTDKCRRGHSFSEVGRSKCGACRECSRLSHWNRKYGRDRYGNEIPKLTKFSKNFSSLLNDMDLINNKHVPSVYLRSSVKQRMRLLQGLMDTDGTCDKRCASAEFTTTSCALKDGFVELAYSLGLKPKVATKNTSWVYQGVKKHSSAFRITFPVPTGFQLFTLPRKTAVMKQASVDVSYRQIVSITPVETRPVKCIQVDSPSHLFLAGRSMIPTHNTMGLLDGWTAYNVTCDPGDMMIVQMTQDKAREFSKTRIDRAIRNSPQLAELMSSKGNDDNTHDKLFKNGMWLKIGWPTVSQLSSSDYRYVGLTDYDRMPDDIDGEGAAFSLALKRTTTFMSRGMCMVESSPGRDITDPNHKPATPHEAPPVGGVIGIYNRSDRRRWYWPCPECSEYFEASPGLGLFNLPPESELLEMIRTTDIGEIATQYDKVVCPCCGSVIDETHKYTMNKKGVWVGEGQHVDSNGVVSGKIIYSSIAGYWLGGVAAAYQSWKSLVLRHLQGLREYALSGSELTLKVTANTDQGIPYTPRLLLESAANAGDPRNRTEEQVQRYFVPDEARFLAASVDVQGGSNARFVVQVHAIGPHMEQWLVDRYNIELSERQGMGAEFAPLDPASYQEDWDLLTKHVVNATYRLTDESRELRIKIIAVDTGGEHKKKADKTKHGEGVSEKAYAWYRKLRTKGLHGRVMLIKGASTPTAPIIRETKVGAQGAGREGDVPLFMINTNLLKDRVSTGLKRKIPGPTYYHFPSWLPPAFFDELAAEVRNTNGTWMQVKKRNEAFDLCGYIHAGCLRLGADKILDWNNAPSWAAPLNVNSDVILAEDRRRLQAETRAVSAPRRSARRVNRSSYL